ncbi:MAG: HDOD domain-containing protein [Desulfobacteraceae bacterium]|nr:HDOD domain-containing protein [Desulfobacteraceae bacterium]
MLVLCDNCEKSYNLPDNRLPQGKVVSFPCPSCKEKISLDLRTGTKKEENTHDQHILPNETAAVEDSKEDLENKDNLKKRILKRVEDLPPMPKVLIKAREIMADPNSSFKEISQVIEKDQAIAASILKVANSAYYGLSGMVSSIHQATVVLGYKTLEQVITMVTSSSLLGKKLKGYGLNAGALWQHSLAVAMGSRFLAQKRAPILENDAFSVGLIHDAGKLALDPYINDSRQELDAYMAQENKSLFEAEKFILGFDHAEIGKDLCEKWKLPESHAIAIRYHHCPSESKDNQLSHIVYLADYMAIFAGLGCNSQTQSKEPDQNSLQALNFKPEDLHKAALEVKNSVDEIIASIS